MNKTNKALTHAYRRGYRVSIDGKRVKGIRKKSLSLTPNSSGYFQFCIRLPIGERYPVDVHRLQAFQKYGLEMFEEGMNVRHLNNNKLDNSWDNIAIGTMSDNSMDMSPRARSMRPMACLSESDVLDIARRVENGAYKHYQLLAEEYGLKSEQSIYNIMNGKTWSYLTGF